MADSGAAADELGTEGEVAAGGEGARAGCSSFPWIVHGNDARSLTKGWPSSPSGSTRSQPKPHLRALGLSTEEIEYRLRVGRLHIVHRGVYAIGHPDITLHGRLLAAVLAVGADAVLSHRSAAVLHGFAPARTLLDLARTERDDRTLKRLLGQTQVERRVSVPQLRREAEAVKHRGATRILTLTAPGPRPTRSGLEDRMFELCDRHGLPKPRSNAGVEGVEVDFLFKQQRVIVETDGGRYHLSQEQQEADRAKQARLEAAGYRVVRVRDDHREEAQTIGRMKAAIITRP